MKSILKPVFCVLIALLTITLTSCNANTKNLKKSTKYTLYGTITNNVVSKANETYNYYYIEFKDNGELVIRYNKIENNIDKEQYGSYTKTENMYIANIDGLTLNYIIKDNGKELECDFLVVHMIFKLQN